MGRTYQGQGLPTNLRLFGRYHDVFAYKPTAVICIQRHGWGHKATVCTNRQQCKMCREVHPDSQPCQGKYCPMCKRKVTRSSKPKRVGQGTGRTTNSRKMRWPVNATIGMVWQQPLRGSGPPPGRYITRTIRPPQPLTPQQQHQQQPGNLKIIHSEALAQKSVYNSGTQRYQQ